MDSPGTLFGRSRAPGSTNCARGHLRGRSWGYETESHSRIMHLLVLTVPSVTAPSGASRNVTLAIKCRHASVVIDSTECQKLFRVAAARSAWL